MARTLCLPPDAGRLTAVVETLDRATGTTISDRLNIVWSDDLLEEGIYHGQTRTISINRNTKQPERVLIHEVAHAIDHLGIGSKQTYATNARHSLLRTWAGRIAASKAVGGLLKLQADNSKVLDQRYVSYLLRMQEIFARSFTQYVATVSGDEPLHKQIAGERKGLYAAAYWSDNDFVLIRKAFDELAEKLQWLKRKP